MKQASAAAAAAADSSNRPRKRRFTKKDAKKEKSPNKENAAKKPRPEETLYSQEEFVKGECSYQMGYACIDMNVLNRLMESIEGSEKEELERRWKELKHQELKLFVEECELVKETNRLILEAWRGSS